MFEKVGNLPDLRRGVCEGRPFCVGSSSCGGFRLGCPALYSLFLSD